MALSDERDIATVDVDIDHHLAKRLRRRRLFLGLTQYQVADACGVRFQQIQKYECGENRISAARLWRLCEALGVPPSYFYDGLSDDRAPAADCEPVSDLLERKETQDLIRAYYQLGERPRRRLLALAVSLDDDNAEDKSLRQRTSAVPVAV